MTALIIEDEIPAGKRLEKLLNQKGFTVLTILVSVKKAFKWLQENNHPEFVFIDIKLRDGNSFQLLEKFQITSKIIVTTAYDDFALKAFEHNAIDYLLKPIDEKKLDKMIGKLNKFQGNQEFKLDNFTEIKYKNSFLIPIGNLLKKIENHDITTFFSEDNASFLTTNQGRILPVNYSLEKLEQEVDPNIFFRISRKYLINRNYIRKVYTKNQISISIENHEEELKVSRLRMKNFLEWYKK
ncbi:LytR/AlgR family response regulator transcription factor [Flavobacterium qiangtangense]|uniref:LytR/AlgR family response regulator transcription factor n=1 Tax=Flavobacterium qiangtangense TaxID=1442595 RepID=A0ABW1PM67_9FLAO